MKKLLIIALLFVGCSLLDNGEVLGSCVFTCSAFIYQGVAHECENLAKCFEGVYNKEECMDKQLTDGNREYSYSSYSDTETCSDYCDSYDGNCHEYSTSSTAD